MKYYRASTVAMAVFAVAVVFTGHVASANADTLDRVFQVGQAKTEANKQSQDRIDKLADETQKLLQDYKQVLKQNEGLKVYNARLDKQIKNQTDRIADIEDSIANVTVISRQVVPLMDRMIDALDQFIDQDYPFKLDERKQRIAFLRKNLDRSDLTVAEKFRQVLEAYKIENEYGRKIDAYTDTIPVNGVKREVKMLHIGRIALLYQTTDTEHCGAWDKADHKWVELNNSEYKNAILKSIRIAEKQASIDIMKVPVQAPEAAQ